MNNFLAVLDWHVLSDALSQYIENASDEPSSQERQALISAAAMLAVADAAIAKAEGSTEVDPAAFKLGLRR